MLGKAQYFNVVVNPNQRTLSRCQFQNELERNLLFSIHTVKSQSFFEQFLQSLQTNFQLQQIQRKKNKTNHIMFSTGKAKNSLSFLLSDTLQNLNTIIHRIKIILRNYITQCISYLISADPIIFSHLKQITQMSMLNKVAICCCCSHCACGVGQCYDCWTAYQSCGLAYLQCGSCCWTICAPICHTCSIGDVGRGMDSCVTGLKYCVFSCLLYCVSPCDGCINCILYQKQNCTNGVSGFKDVTKNTMFIGNRVKDALGLAVSNQPQKTFGTYSP